MNELDSDQATTPLTSDQLIEALSRDDELRSARGYRQRFAVSAESIRLRSPRNKAEEAIEKANGQVKEQLIESIMDMTPEVFEHLVAELFTAMKYEDVRVTGRSRDGGVDVHATLVAGGVISVPTAIQVKRWKKSVRVNEIRQLRGTLHPGMQGIIVTTGNYTRDALREALGNALTPIHLIDGALLADLLTEFGIGVQASRLSLLSLSQEALDTIHERVAKGAATISLGGVELKPSYYIDKAPSSDGRTLLECIIVMTDLAKGQPALECYIARFQEAFPRITREDEARRRSRVLTSLGLAEIENGHMVLTLAGRNFLDAPSAQFLVDLLIARIVGAREIMQLRSSRTRQELRSGLEISPPEGLTPTQAKLIEAWLYALGA
ncbi:restriction endonuclease [Streptomyces sp. UH6]|uniref:restriction endonuclease n=1 Tax=Streptomyces sp. UH6 TaxID=2748379 RepID=UPI0015D4ABE3|nr:restriction endonuclease [Streptomyces sp. UH6]NYV73213.1 restriction endonuclease [Streptomyces sp. UH6]